MAWQVAVVGGGAVARMWSHAERVVKTASSLLLGGGPFRMVWIETPREAASQKHGMSDEAPELFGPVVKEEASSVRHVASAQMRCHVPSKAAESVPEAACSELAYDKQVGDGPPLPPASGKHELGYELGSRVLVVSA